MAIRAAVIGAGSIARMAELPSIREERDVELVGVCSRRCETAEAAAQQFGIRAWYTDVEVMLEQTKPDCVFVLTPVQTHHQFCKLCLENGIDVFCEKPLADNLADAEELVNLAENSDRVFMVGFNRRYAPVYRLAKELFSEGPPDICIAEKHNIGPEPRALLENAIHVIDLIRWFCGEPLSVSAAAKVHDPYLEEAVTAHLVFPQGHAALFATSRHAGEWFERLTLLGQGRHVIVDSPDQVTVIADKRETVTRMTPRAGGWSTLIDRMGFKQEVSHFLECVRKRQQPETTAREAYQTLMLVNRIYLSAGLPALGA